MPTIWRLTLSAAILSLTGLVAGCSRAPEHDVLRQWDGGAEVVVKRELTNEEWQRLKDHLVRRIEGKGPPRRLEITFYGDYSKKKVLGTYRKDPNTGLNEFKVEGGPSTGEQPEEESPPSVR